MLETIKQCTDYILSKIDFEPQFGLILGTGLGAVAKQIDTVLAIDYQELPHFPISTVESHSGKLLFGYLAGKKIVAMQGRFHYYEGYSLQQVTFPVRVMHALGIKGLFVSNASGGLNPAIKPGDIMVQVDHINLQPDSPLRGPHHPSFGPRFPDLSDAYYKPWIERAETIAQEENITLFKGVYVSVPGPNLETPAEYKYLRIIGGDAVGMSTVPEVIVARQLDVPCFAISAITDEGFPAHPVKVTMEMVLAAAAIAEPKMTKILTRLIGSL